MPDFASVLMAPAMFKGGRARFRGLARADRGVLASGRGVLGGAHPDGVTTLDNVPHQARVRVLVRSSNPSIDGLLVHETVSTAAGVWQVGGLHPDMRFDVVGRLAGYNDEIQAGVAPEVP